MYRECTKGICCHEDTILEFDSEDACTSDNWLSDRRCQNFTLASKYTLRTEYVAHPQRRRQFGGGVQGLGLWCMDRRGHYAAMSCQSRVYPKYGLVHTGRPQFVAGK